MQLQDLEAMTLILYTSHDDDGQKSLIAADICEVEVEVVKRVLVRYCGSKFLDKNPMEKLPMLETSDGDVIWGSNAVARHVARLNHERGLFGNSELECSYVDQWIEFATSEIDRNIDILIYPPYDFCVCAMVGDEEVIYALKKALQALDKHLSTRKYLVGNSVTLADIVLTCELTKGYKKVLTKSFMSNFTQVDTYFWNMMNHPSFSKITGQIKQAEDKDVPELKKSPYSDKPKVSMNLQLDTSNLILNEWKRVYFSSKIKSNAIKAFWDMYDSQKVSLWFCDSRCKFCANKIWVTGSIGKPETRMDVSVFGKILIKGFGEVHKVKGLWIFPGTSIPRFMIECGFKKLYDWSQVDTNDEVQRNRANEIISHNDQAMGVLEQIYW